MAYNMTPWEESENIAEGLATINTITGTQIITTMLVVTTFLVIFFVLLKKNEPKISVLAASFSTSIVLLFLFIAGLTHLVWFIAFVMLTAAAAISIYLTG